MAKPILELRWRAPELPQTRPEVGVHVEVAFLRFQRDHHRVTVTPVVQHTHITSPLAPSVPVPATAHGWGVAMDGDLLEGSALSFQDACYAAWAVFVQIVPNLARQLTQAMAWEIARQDDEALFAASEVYVEPGHVGTPTFAGGDQGGEAEAEAESAGLRPAGGPTGEAGAAPVRLDGKPVGSRA